MAPLQHHAESATDMCRELTIGFDMRFETGILLLGVMMLGACSTGVTREETSSVVSVPDAVVQVADPDQDLTTARLRPEDNCYWYEHNGPVETTLLPLRTPNGNQICVAQSG